MNRTTTATVIGGGIAGAVCAMALQRAGITATIYEAHIGSDEAVGGGLTLAPNGVAALDVIGCGDLVRELGDPMTGIVLESWNGKQLGAFTSGGEDQAALFLWRGRFSAALRAEAAARGIRILSGARFVDAVSDADAVEARFADGTTARAEVLIGADGIHSRVRSVIDPAAPDPSYTGLVGYGGARAGSGLAPSHGTMRMSFGKRAFFGYRVNDDGTAEWFANLPSAVPPTSEQLRARSAEATLDILRAAFADDRTRAADLIAGSDPASLVTVGPLEIMPRLPHWSRDGVVVIGDAAHAASPSSGQGASLAIESAIELARHLRDLPRDEALAAYETARRPRVERIIAAAEKTNSSKAAGPVGRVVRDLVMPVAMRMMRPERQSWQTDYRIAWDAGVAR
ncbi:FAD-dependent oxidoreductase [Diaminobutyricibacter sp. McL0608]|uniref:FAD-dependent oxidoreductase n=1 Tax=Leifsonia sp. McL0608 TaxID=3143537 RepID=UPI0031F2DF9B